MLEAEFHGGPIPKRSLTRSSIDPIARIVRITTKDFHSGPAAHEA